MRKIISTVLLVGTFLVISCMFFFSNFFTKGNYPPSSVIAPKQNSTYYFPHTHFQSSNHFHYGYNTDYPINQSMNSSSYGLLTQNKSQSRIRLLQKPSQGLSRQSSYGPIHLLTQNSVNLSSSRKVVTSTTQNSSEAIAFYAAASRQPFSTPEALIDDLHTGPQYSFPNKDTIPVPTMPLGDALIPSLILIALFTFGKRNIF